MNLKQQNNQITQTQEKHEPYQWCFQCRNDFPRSVLNFMAQFNAYVCTKCYEYESNIIMEYKKNKPTLYSEFDEIQEGLYLGNQDAACDQLTFYKTGVTAICACGSYLLTPFEDKFQYKKYKIGDCPTQKIMDLFDENFQWITKMRKQNKKILVHCAAGVSRSASFVIAYLMRSRNMPYLQAHSYVKTRRPIIHPNSGFIEQLRQYEKSLLLSNFAQIEKQTDIKE